MNFSSQTLLDQLNDAQKQAVTAVEGPVLVVAGAGSGKTRVITYRTAYLLLEGIASAENLLAVTFTNKAAAEMKQRITSLAGEGFRPPAVMTFHAFGSFFLRRHIPLLGYTRDFQIFDEDDQLSLVKESCRDLHLPDTRYLPKEVHYFLKSQRSRLDPPAFLDPNIKNVANMYSRKMKELNAVDFDDLLSLPLRILKENQEIRERYQNQYLYVMVDEYQDTNEIQYEFLKILSGKTQNLFVVGDEDQSIYKFRGARPENINQFTRDFPAAKIIKLEQNYRSTKTIIKAAHAVISNNNARIKKELWTDNDPGEPIEVYQAFDEYDEATYVTLRVMAALKNSTPAEIAVLYRANAQSRAIEESFVKAQIPHRIVGAVGFYERREIKDIIAYLRLSVNHHDNLSFSRIVNVPPRGVGKKMYQEIEYESARNKISLYDATVRIGDRATSKFLSLFEPSLEQFTPSAFLEDLLKRVGYADYLKRDDSATADDRLENIQEFITYLREREISEDFILSDFINDLPLQSRQEKREGEAVTLLTVHSAKGLEFKNLFVIGMEEGLFPHSRSLERTDDVEEERRLFYVAVTRAKQKLTLNWSQRRGVFGANLSNRPSRFLEEIPSWFKITKLSERFQSPATTRATKASSSSINAVNTEAIGEFRTGSVIRHEKLGRGTILNVEGTPGDCKLTVRFRDGVKKILTRYASIVVEK